MIIGPSPNGIEFAGKRTTPALALGTKTWVHSQTSFRKSGNAEAAGQVLEHRNEKGSNFSARRV